MEFAFLASTFIAQFISMLKKVFICASIIFSAGLMAQKTIVVNGGQFGNSSENVNVMVHDPLSNSYSVIDTIHTSSVQELIIEGDFVFVAAQDSIVKYDMKTSGRLAAAAFPGVSTKSMAIHNNELLVGNFYGKSSDNLYIFDKTNLNLLDSVSAVSLAAKSILVQGAFAYVNQNIQSSGFSDSLGWILKIDVANRAVVDTLRVNAYDGDLGELLDVDGQTFISLNSTSNTIASFSYTSPQSATTTSLSSDLKVGGRSHYSRFRDTLFTRMDDGIGAIDLNLLQVLDTNIIDTVITGFAYDTINHQFSITQTNFFSYQLGGVYQRNGTKIKSLPVGFSPEVIRSYYGNATSIFEIAQNEEAYLIYPIPARDFINIEPLDGQELTSDIQIFDLSGKLVLEKWNNQFKTINVSNLNPGIYLLSLRSKNAVFNSKIVIE